MKKSKIILSFFIAFSIIACNSEQPKEKKEQVEESTTFEEEVNSDQKSSLQQNRIGKDNAKNILADYFDIKDALVKSDAEAAKSAAENIVATSKNKSLKKFESIYDDAKKIANTNNIEEQRKHFESLSNSVYEMVKSTKANNTTIYRQYCPMAMDNKGAYWLSEEDKIRNPYFGDKMLKCGSVKETL